MALKRVQKIYRRRSIDYPMVEGQAEASLTAWPWGTLLGRGQHGDRERFSVQPRS